MIRTGGGGTKRVAINRARTKDSTACAGCPGSQPHVGFSRIRLSQGRRSTVTAAAKLPEAAPYAGDAQPCLRGDWHLSAGGPDRQRTWIQIGDDQAIALFACSTRT